MHAQAGSTGRSACELTGEGSGRQGEAQAMRNQAEAVQKERTTTSASRLQGDLLHTHGQ